MLDGLDEINWSQLHHAYGEASDVPALIRKLLSQDKDERDKAVHELFGNIWHQGTVYEASSHAVPSLYELLKLPETPDKLIVAFLLADLATGRSYLYQHVKNEKDKVTWQKILAERGETLEDAIAREQAYESKVRESIRKEFTLLYPYLSCEVPEIRDDIAKAFGEYPQFKSETLPLLEKALVSENDEFARETIENSIKILTNSEQQSSSQRNYS